MRIAALDVGSNSFHLLVVDAQPDGHFETLVREKEMLRLGDVVSREGRITAGDIEKDVRFEDADPALNDQIDAAYRSKYLRHGAQWVNLTVSSEGRSTTMKLVPL